MPELFKLNNIPKKQRCRKILRILESAEDALVNNRPDEFLDAFYLKEILKIALQDLDKSNAEKIQRWINSPDENNKRNIINFTRYELYKSLDIAPAEWDLIMPNATQDELKDFRRKFFKNVFVYAEDIRTPFNIGSIFRTSESFGVEKVFLSRNSASPENSKAKRTAMGCIDYLDWDFADLDELPDLPIIALETGGTNINDFQFPNEGIVIIGSEELGVSPEALKKAGKNVVSIPMFGIKASINVSNALGICLHKWCEHLNK